MPTNKITIPVTYLNNVEHIKPIVKRVALRVINRKLDMFARARKQQAFNFLVDRGHAKLLADHDIKNPDDLTPTKLQIIIDNYIDTELHDVAEPNDIFNFAFDIGIAYGRLEDE